MLVIPNPPFRKRRRPPKIVRRPILPAELTLTGATFSTEDDCTLTLTFDRPVSIENFDASQVVIDDHPDITRYVATGGVLVNPLTVRISTTPSGEIEGGETFVLNAGNTNAICAADDQGNIWLGVEGLELPFP